MNPFLENTYYRLPVFLQHFLVSLYGWKLYRERYNDDESRYIHHLLETQKYSYDEMEAYQEEKFVKMARHAIRSVPFYRNWAIKNNFDEFSIDSLADLQKFPVLGKEEIKKHPEKFVSNKYVTKKNLLKLSTSGTTGSPLTIYCNSNVRTNHFAFNTRLRGWFGLNRRSKRATLCGRIITLPAQNKPPFWRYDLGQNNLLMSSYHLSSKNLPYYYQKLKSFKPEEIIAYPSSIYQIAQYIDKECLPPVKAKVIITTAETLLVYQRSVIERAFDAPLIDQYGCTEMVFFASQCEHGTMHVHPEEGIVETIDEQGNNVRGQSGILVATGLINWVMPLIRYKVGDRVTLAEERKSCPCGRSFPILSSIEGRVDDILYRKDGTPVGRLDPVFKGGSEIKEAKIIQTRHGDIQVLLSPGEGFTPNNRHWLERELQKRLGSDISISIKEVDEIPKEKNGKFKAVESYFHI